MFRLILSAIVGWFIGKERKKHDKSGGSRTLAMLCLSACLVSILSIELSKLYTFDILRLMQGTLQGIGFIGAGVIWQNKKNIEGITTSATLFSVIIIGFLIGVKMFYYGLTSAVLIYIILESKYLYDSK
jgi:putative Mg2+ transporter-C (MgtC) family protein